MSLWSLDPWDFAQTDLQMEQAEKREEWARLHGDGQPSTPNQEIAKCLSPSSSE